jgi:hypothetical protein
MVWQPVRIALLFGAVAAVAVSPARADCTPAPAPCCPPATKTITVTECVPETFKTTRTAYKTECKVETYTAYKTECVPETRTRTCTTYTKVPEVHTECRNVCVKVPVCEERVCMKKCWKNETVTTMVCKTVDKGHYECKEVPDHCKELCNRIGRLCHRHNDCCCEPAPCPATKTVKCWVPCMVTEQCPVTCCKKVCYEVPVKTTVTVCKTEIRQEKFQVCTYKCVPVTKTECYTVNVSKCVPYQATRTVQVCVPFQEVVTCTRMVSRTVTREVPVTTCEAAPACGCEGSHGHKHHHLFAGLCHREKATCGCGCE